MKKEEALEQMDLLQEMETILKEYQELIKETLTELEKTTQQSSE